MRCSAIGHHRVRDPGPGRDVQFNLDCTLATAAAGCTPGGPYGYVQLVDSGNNIDVTVVVFNGTPIWALSLNWINPANPSPTAGWSATGGNIGANTIEFALDGTGLGNRFDILISEPGPPASPLGAPSNPLTFTLAKLELNLDPSFFVAKDEFNQFYAAVRAGATSETAVRYGAASVVPEPATLTLLGLGLVGMAFRLRARRK